MWLVPMPVSYCIHEFTMSHGVRKRGNRLENRIESRPMTPDSRVNIHDTSRSFTYTNNDERTLLFTLFRWYRNKYNSNFRNNTKTNRKLVTRERFLWMMKIENAGNRVSSKSFQLFLFSFPFDKSSMCLHNASPPLPKLFVSGRHKCREEDWKRRGKRKAILYVAGSTKGDGRLLTEER